MRKIVSSGLVIMMLLALCSCGGKESSPMETNNQENVTDKDMIAVELVYMYPQTDNITSARIKVRNLSDEAKDYISFDIQALDENGDAIATTGIGAENVDAGQAVMPSGWWQFDCKYDDIASLKIKSYEFLTDNGNGTYGNGTSYQLNNPITLVFSGETSEENNSATGYMYSWIPTN